MCLALFIVIIFYIKIAVNLLQTHCVDPDQTLRRSSASDVCLQCLLMSYGALGIEVYKY